MSIYLVDNFELGVNKPIDNRFVVGTGFFYTTKESITNKYTGLRVWDIGANKAFVWNGSNWIEEITGGGGGTVGPGTINRISRFITSSTIGDSIISQSGTSIGVNNNNPQYALDVTGNIYCSAGFIGIGSQITSINANNISSGSLNLARITSGSAGQILVRGQLNAEFVNADTIFGVGSSKAISITNLSNDSTTIFDYLTFVDGVSGDQNPRVSNKLTFQTSGILSIQGSIRIGTGPTTNKATIQYSSGVAKTFNIPTDGSTGPFTFALIDKNQTFTGDQTFSGNIIISNSGSATSPSIRLSDAGIFFQHTSGGFAGARSLYMDSSGNLITGGNSGAQFQNFRLNSTQFRVGNDVTGTPLIRVGNNTTPTAPSYTFFGNDQCGMYREAQNVLAFCTTGTKRVTITSNGSIGIGTTNFNYGGSSIGGIGKAINPGGGTPTGGDWSLVGASSGATVQLAVSGGIGAQFISVSSDKRIKKEIKTINGSLNKILNLKPVEYKWNLDDDLLNDDLVYYGFIAQDVEEVMPEIVRVFNDEKLEGGRLMLHYESIIAHLTKGIQEQQSIIEDLTKRIENLES